jgi:hypothetical protein
MICDCVGWAKRQRAHHLHLCRDGGHGANAPLPPDGLSASRPRERGDPYAAASLWARWLTASASTNCGGYGSLRSQGRRTARPAQRVVPANAGTHTPRPLDSITDVSGILDHPHSRVMTRVSSSHAFTSPQRQAPGLLPSTIPPHIKGRRECRALGAPAALCAKVKKHTSIVTTVTPKTPGIPRAMVLTVSFALSSVTGLVCHRHPQEALLLENLTPASGRQDHTTSPSAARALRLCAPKASTASRALRS